MDWFIKVLIRMLRLSPLLDLFLLIIRPSYINIIQLKPSIHLVSDLTTNNKMKSQDQEDILTNLFNKNQPKVFQKKALEL